MSDVAQYRLALTESGAGGSIRKRRPQSAGKKRPYETRR